MNNHPPTMSGNCGPQAALDQAISGILAEHETGTVALAVSGGIDSMVLLETTKRLLAAGTSPLSQCLCLHVDHGLRSESHLDAEFVAEEAANAGIECQVLAASINKDTPGSLEEKARVARYELLYRTMDERGIKILLTAQHQDDLAETVMIQHMRGADLLGLAGMPEQRHLVAGQAEMVYRPFLQTSSAAIAAFAKSNGTRWREDRSNKDLRHRRNLVRNLIFPMMSEQDDTSAWRHRLTNLAQGVKRANQKIVKMALAIEATTDLVRDVKKSSKSVALLLEGLQILPPEVSYHLLERQLPTIDAPAGTLTPKNFAQIITAQEAGEVIELRRHVHASTLMVEDELWLKLESKFDAEVEQQTAPQVVTIKSGDRLQVEGLGVLEIDMFDEANQRKTDNEQWLPMSALRGELTLRAPIEGERIDPFGMSGTKLVSDLMQEAGVPSDERWQRPLVADDAGILWVPLIRASERCRILGPKGPFLRLRFESAQAP